MTIKFETIKPGMTLYDRRKVRMGNTALRCICIVERRVIVSELDAEGRRALVSWNDNPANWWDARRLSKLSSWSMHDEGVEVRRGMLGRVISVKKGRKA